MILSQLRDYIAERVQAGANAGSATLVKMP